MFDFTIVVETKIFLSKRCGEPTSLSLNNIIKGIVSQDEYFFEGPKNQNIIFCMSADGFDHFWLSFCDDNQK